MSVYFLYSWQKSLWTPIVPTCFVAMIEAYDKQGEKENIMREEFGYNLVCLC